MQLIFFLVMPLQLAATGSMETEYNSSNKAILNCIFPENFTRTEFSVYFYYENDNKELLVDCAWVGDKLDCIQQEGFKCRLSVPDIAEIEVPQSFVTRPGRIGWILSGENPNKIKSCHFVENHSEGQNESQHKRQQNNTQENNKEHKAQREFPVWIIGLVIGAVLALVVTVIIIVLYKKICRKNTQTHTSEELDAESPSLESTENKNRYDNRERSSDFLFNETVDVDEEDRAAPNSRSQLQHFGIYSQKSC